MSSLDVSFGRTAPPEGEGGEDEWDENVEFEGSSNWESENDFGGFGGGDGGGREGNDNYKGRVEESELERDVKRVKTEEVGFDSGGSSLDDGAYLICEWVGCGAKVPLDQLESHEDAHGAALMAAEGRGPSISTTTTTTTTTAATVTTTAGARMEDIPKSSIASSFDEDDGETNESSVKVEDVPTARSKAALAALARAESGNGLGVIPDSNEYDWVAEAISKAEAHAETSGGRGRGGYRGRGRGWGGGRRGGFGTIGGLSSGGGGGRGRGRGGGGGGMRGRSRGSSTYTLNAPQESSRSYEAQFRARVKWAVQEGMITSATGVDALKSIEGADWKERSDVLTAEKLTLSALSAAYGKLATKTAPDSVLLSRPTTHFSASWGDRGWGCGYRNAQMLLSALQRAVAGDSLPGAKTGVNLVGAAVLRGRKDGIPTVPAIQTEITVHAWGRGWDPAGRKYFNGSIENTKTWIGASDVAALLSSYSVPIQLTEFTAPAGVEGQARLQAAMGAWLWKYFSSGPPEKRTKLPAGWLDGQQTITGMFASSAKGARKRKAAAVDPIGPGTGVWATPVFPVMMQWNGHSVTIVGMERARNGKVGMLVLDPSRWSKNVRVKLGGATRQFAGVRRSLETLKKSQYQLLTVPPEAVAPIMDEAAIQASKNLVSVKAVIN